MIEKSQDVFYYITVMNENYSQPSLPPGAADSVLRGMYRFQSTAKAGSCGAVRLLGSGAILREVIAASRLLADDWAISSDVWSVTSFTELARDAREVERWNRLHPKERRRSSYIGECLAGDAPIVAATDYVCAYPDSVAGFVDAPYRSLGTDGFGRSDNRASLRRFFEVDRQHIVIAALHALAETGTVADDVVAAAIKQYEIDPDQSAPWMR
jgi:pyruvate dehydrogenase E1 component